MNKSILYIMVLSATMLLTFFASQSGYSISTAEKYVLLYKWKSGETFRYRYILTGKEPGAEDIDWIIAIRSRSIKPNGSAILDANLTSYCGMTPKEFQFLALQTDWQFSVDRVGRTVLLPSDSKKKGNSGKSRKELLDLISEWKKAYIGLMVEPGTDFLLGNFNGLLLPDIPVAIGEKWQSESHIPVKGKRDLVVKFEGTLLEVNKSNNESLAHINGILMLPFKNKSLSIPIEATFDIIHGRVISILWKPIKIDPYAHERRIELVVSPKNASQ